MQDFKISVIGAGFVGLTTSLGLARKGFNVLCIEKNRTKLLKLKKNKVYFYEPMLEENLKILQRKKKIEFSENFAPDKNKINVIFICVGTPVKKKVAMISLKFKK